MNLRVTAVPRTKATHPPIMVRLDIQVPVVKNDKITVEVPTVRVRPGQLGSAEMTEFLFLQLVSFAARTDVLIPSVPPEIDEV